MSLSPFKEKKDHIRNYSTTLHFILKQNPCKNRIQIICQRKNKVKLYCHFYCIKLFFLLSNVEYYQLLQIIFQFKELEGISYFSFACTYVLIWSNLNLHFCEAFVLFIYFYGYFLEEVYSKAQREIDFPCTPHSYTFNSSVNFTLQHGTFFSLTSDKPKLMHHNKSP